MHQQQEKTIAERQPIASCQNHPASSPPFLGESNYILGRIQSLENRLGEAIYPERNRVEQLEIAGPVERIPPSESTALNFRSVKLGESLGPTFATFWFRLRIQVPVDWKGRRVDLAWRSNSEALLWMEGRSVQGFNPGRDTAMLIEEAVGGEEFTVFVEVACNHLLGADGVPGLPWPEISARSSHWLEMCEIRCFDQDAWDLYHDVRVLTELVADRVPLQLTRAIGPEKKPLVRPALDPAWAGQLLYDLNAVCNTLDLSNRKTWRTARKMLSKLLDVSNGGVCHELSAIGHAHIDTAWLWPLAESYRKTVRTFSSAVRNMDDYPEFLFACSQAYQYECIERQNPDLFGRILAKTDSGQWVPVGGTYIEPDCILPSGESLCRQFLFGQRYFESRFDHRCTEFWNPDVFGYSGQLPQIMQLAGIDKFLTQKLSWNRFTSPPHHTFYWESPDGSRVLTHFPPADTYSGTCEVEELRYHAANYKNSDRGHDAYYLFGHGDGGGGPTPEMLETLRRTEDLLGVPRCKQRTPEQFFEQLEKNTRSIPTIVGELYLELHRATYTSQAMMKRGLRKSERLLHDIELVGVLAHSESQAVYPKEGVDQLWKKLLLNQFHDILPGSSIAQVHEQARADFASILEYGQAIRDELLDQLASDDSQPNELLPLNTTSVSRREVVDVAGRGLTLVESPSVGFGRHVPGNKPFVPVAVELHEGKLHLQNGLMTVVLSESGEVLELVDLESSRQILSTPGNKLVLHEDRPSLWDAWDVEPSILETGQDCEPASRCEIQSKGPLRAEIVFERSIGRNSTMTQTVRLDADSRRLEFDCEVEWQEEHQLLKVLFPTTVRSDRATFEMPFGFAERPTHRNTAADAAQFEVPGHRWADLSEPGYGLGLLTDCKYGFSVDRGVLALSLLRAPTYPDKYCDIGKHQFSYAVVPHQGDWRRGKVVSEATTFNQPLLWVNRPSSDAGQSLFTVEGDLVLDTIKPAEEGDGVVVRLYDPYGQHGKAVLKSKLPFTTAWNSNIMEDDLEQVDLFTELSDENNPWNCVPIDYRPSEIVCLHLT
ncbi:alpha-mannosidase [Bythopirellula polymerisocia]|uniref:alpha-mannosidase n=1 Tax=Bythopirellula polymerisocia TaxID=2528003 RepID=A0A5C6CGH6_9BACT|nr:glycoside hydrolase family 38 C-terminal domain-containing protein [Bythopirellula polymerisocia]TWU21839.1 Mannosylglycerate hydrolase [Bythopirellula polymerisocia]